jgi:hypothetical protein
VETLVELLDRFGPLLLAGHFGLSFVLTALACYTLQALSDKTTAVPSWVAWVPLLQTHAFLRAAGVRYAVLFAWLGAGIALGIAGASFSGGGSPPGAVALLLIAYVAGMLAWLLALFWRLAEHRGLSGWLGLACCIPFLGLLFFSYLALHDGRVRASRFGLALTALLALLATANLHASLREMRGLLSGEGHPAAGQISAEEQEILASLLQSWRGAAGAGRPSEGHVDDAPGLLDRLRAWTASLSEGDPTRVVAVPDAVVCGPGTRLVGARPPQGHALYCEREHDGVKHGSYLAWHPNGSVAESGSYATGRRQGVWTRFWETGGRRARVHFEGDREHGVLVVWDELGRVEQEIRYLHGEPGPR